MQPNLLQPTPALAAPTRDARIDILRGITMLLVVAIHVLPEGPARCFSLVTMPLAFMLSGHLHHARLTLGAFARDKTLSLLVPYGAYLALFGVAWAAQRHAMEGVPWSESLAKLAYGGERLKGTMGIFWFITCLFITQQLFNVCLAFPALRARLPWIALGAYLAALANEHGLESAPLPLAANVALMAFGFYWFGYAQGAWLLRGGSRLLPVALVISLAGIMLELRFNTLHFELKRTHYGWPLVSPLVAMALAACMACLAGALSRFGPLARPLAWAGRATITIMFAHQYVHHAWLKDFAAAHPFAALLLIYPLCCGLHALLGLSRITRQIFRGERNALRGPAVERALLEGA